MATTGLGNVNPDQPWEYGTTRDATTGTGRSYNVTPGYVPPLASYGGYNGQYGSGTVTGGGITTVQEPGMLWGTNDVMKYNPMVGEGISPEATIAINQGNIANQRYVDNQNSFMGQAQPYITGFASAAQGLGSLASIYTGFKSLGLYEDQVDIAKEQWAETKSELTRVKGVRDKINTNYMA